MRGAFIRTLTELAATDERIFLLTGDLGYMALEPFIERFPDRFINVGVAEQNMVGLATGLAEAGYIPFVYSIVTFASLRPFEFIRNGPIAHNLPVRIIGVGGGLEYGHNGITHWGLEDVGVMRTQPGISIMAPCDHQQTRTVLEKTWNMPGPVYYRLGKDDKSIVPGLNGNFELGKAQVVGNGSDVLIIAMGGIALQAKAAVDVLAAGGISSTLLLVASVNPAPLADIKMHLGRFQQVMTVEAHYLNGSLGSLVAEVIAENGISCKLTRCGIGQCPDGTTGSQAFLYERFGLSQERLADRARTLVEV